jgi:hypothetical protein
MDFRLGELRAKTLNRAGRTTFGERLATALFCF